MSIQGGLISGADHVGLPSSRLDWPSIREFWGSLGLVCHTYEVESQDYDHAGAGPRLQVFSGTKLVVSYYAADGSTRGFLEAMMRRMHVALTARRPHSM